MCPLLPLQVSFPGAGAWGLRKALIPIMHFQKIQRWLLTGGPPSRTLSCCCHPRHFPIFFSQLDVMCPVSPLLLSPLCPLAIPPPLPLHPGLCTSLCWTSQCSCQPISAACPDPSKWWHQHLAYHPLHPILCHHCPPDPPAGEAKAGVKPGVPLPALPWGAARFHQPHVSVTRALSKQHPKCREGWRGLCPPGIWKPLFILLCETWVVLILPALCSI